VQKNHGETPWRSKIDFDEPAAHCGHWQPLRGRNSFPRAHASRDGNLPFGQQSPHKTLSGYARHLGKSDHGEGRHEPNAKIMASPASGKTWKVCSVRKETEISEDRGPHGVVLRELPEANLIKLSRYVAAAAGRFAWRATVAVTPSGGNVRRLPASDGEFGLTNRLPLPRATSGNKL